MLDIYFIDDFVDTIDFPIEENYIDSIEIEEHQNLIKIRILLEEMGIKFSFFDDIRLTSTQVNKILNLINLEYSNLMKLNQQEKIAIPKFRKILELAAENNLGIVCFSD